MKTSCHVLKYMSILHLAKIETVGGGIPFWTSVVLILASEIQSEGR